MRQISIDVGAIITGVAALVTAALAWFKYSDARRRTPVARAADGNTQIVDKINALVRAHDLVELVTVAEVTNGGGIPETGKPLYIRAMFSTDAETLLLFGEKYLMESALITAVSRTILKGDTFFTPDELSDPRVKSWFDAKGIKKTFYFLIGIDQGRRVLLLIVNSSEVGMMAQDQYFKILACAKEIKNIIAPAGLFKKKLIT